MAASVRIEDEAFSDVRVELLGTLAGYNRFEAIGRLAHLWRLCTQRATHVVSEAIVTATLGDLGVAALLGAELGERCEGGIRVCGTEGRIEWLEIKRAAAKAGGEANRRRLAATREPNGYPPPKPEQAKRDPNVSPPAPAPAPAQKKDVPALPDGCLALADSLRDYVLADQPTNALAHKPWPPVRLKWAREFDLMLRVDKRPEADVIAALSWLFTGQTGTARYLVQSPNSLREKWDRIAIARSRPVAPQLPWQRQQTEVRHIKRLDAPEISE